MQRGRYSHLRFLGLLLSGVIAAFEVGCLGDNANAATYDYGSTKAAPYLPFSYNPRKVRVQRASISMIAADFVDAGNYSFYGPNGELHAKPLDLNGLPFWIYAEYLDSESKCQYDFIEGLRPPPHKQLPEVGSIFVREDPAASAVVRNCGRGFELVSREGYVSIYDSQFHSPYLAGNPSIGGEVKKGLIRDYVNRLLTAFGGKVVLQNKLDEGLRRAKQEHPQHAYVIMEPLAAVLVAAGIRIPPESIQSN